MLWTGLSVFCAVTASLVLLSARSQDEMFSKTELKRIVPLSEKLAGSNACFGIEATFSGPLKEKPKAVMDIERQYTIQGTFTKLLEAVSIAPDKVRYLMNDPTACEALKNSKPRMSITVMEGQGADGRPLFPSERSIQAR
ncbi:MAG: hypothetical protein V1798_04710 [Pseudomonadota bacterium]